MRIRSIAVSLLGFVALAPAAADEVVVFPVNRRAKAFGTIQLPTDAHSWVADGPRGARVVARVRRKGTGEIVPGLDVLEEDLDVVVPGTDSARGQRVSGDLLESGDHRFRVTSPAGADGDYLLTIVVRPQKTWREREGGELVPGAEETFQFAAPAGSIARFECRPQRRSAYEPELIEVTGPDGFVHAFDTGTATARRHIERDIVLDGSGEYVVRFRNAGAETGGWRLKVRLKLLAQTRTVQDLRLAEGETEAQTVVGGALVPGEAVGGDPDSDLGATQVTAGAGEAPPTGTTASLREGEDLDPDGDLNTAGDPIEVTIDGAFEGEVQYTGEYDPQAYDGDADEVANVSFLVCHADTGETELIGNEDVDVDAAANTGTFPVGTPTGKRGPSPRRVFTVQPLSPRARPVRGTFIELEVRGAANADHEGEVTFGLNTLHGFAGARTGNAFTRDVARRTLTWRLVRGLAQLEYSETNSQAAGTIDVTSNAEIDLVTPGPRRTLVRGRSRNVFLHRRLDGDLLVLGASLRRAKGTPTPFLLAGSYRALVWEVSGTRNADGTVTLASAGQTAQLTVGKGGRVTASSPRRQTATAVFPGNGAWKVRRDTASIGAGQMDPLGDDARLSMQLGSPSTRKAPGLSEVVLAPVLRGAALVGMASRVDGSTEDPDRVILRQVVLVRHDQGARTSDLDGRSVAGAFTLRALDRVVAPPDAALALLRIDLRHDGVGGVMIDGAQDAVEHDGTGEVVRLGGGVSKSAKYSIKSNGTYFESNPRSSGAVTRRGELLVTTRFVNGDFQLRFATPARPQ